MDEYEKLRLSLIDKVDDINMRIKSKRHLRRMDSEEEKRRAGSSRTVGRQFVEGNDEPEESEKRNDTLVFTND